MIFTVSWCYFESISHIRFIPTVGPHIFFSLLATLESVSELVKGLTINIKVMVIMKPEIPATKEISYHVKNKKCRIVIKLSIP